MAQHNKSFFERLTGTINLNNNDEDDYRQGPQDFRDQQEDFEPYEDEFRQPSPRDQRDASWPEDSYGTGYEEDEGELAIDLYETPDKIVLQAMVAGVRPDQLDVSITREMCTITGRREGPRSVPAEDYFHEELYWGSFSRTVSLPGEVEVEESEATESHGLLTIEMPKINKDRETKLEIKTN